jgi:hypothetical protein
MRFHNIRLLAVPTLLFACAGGGGTPAVAPAPSATTDSRPAGICTATIGDKVLAGWVPVGVVEVALRAGSPTSIQAVDAGGNVVGTEPVTSPDKLPEKVLVRNVCLTGGLMGIFPERPGPQATSMKFLTYRPAKADESADLADLCSKPVEIEASYDQDQEMVHAWGVYGDRLTSTKWRTWLYQASARVHANDATYIAVAHVVGAELQTQAQRTCYFADLLVHRARAVRTP